VILIELTEEERALLVELLENDIIELRGEISDNHRLYYREMLKAREALMKKLKQEFAMASAE
jgi:hypothetical protein